MGRGSRRCLFPGALASTDPGRAAAVDVPALGDAENRICFQTHKARLTW